MRSSITRKRSRAAPIIPMCGPISVIVFAFSTSHRRRSNSTEIAQKENPLHENSLFNQISLFADLLHDNERAEAVARDFITRFPQSQRVGLVRERMLQLQNASKSRN